MAKKKPTMPPADEPPKPRTSRRGSGKSAAGIPPQGQGGPPSPSRPLKVRTTTGPTELEKALAVALRAAESFDPKERLSLARQAVAICPDCVEAYLLLAELAKTRKQALAYQEQAVEASARVLGPSAFHESAGHFWGLVETRPYMRARLGLAEALWSSGRRDEAVEHLREMLRLNPGDNQGLRYILAGWYLNLDQLDRLDGLLQDYDEDSSTWAYTKALVAFKREGDSTLSRKRFASAKKANKHVPAYLVGRKPLPAEPPVYYSPGDEDDAVLYVGNNLGAWKSTLGAIPWVRSKQKERRRRPKSPVSTGPTPESAEQLLTLPSEIDAWQADFRQFARRVEIAGERVRPWMVLVSSRTRELVLAHAMTELPPSPEEFWDLLAGAMRSPSAGEPHRPTELSIRPGGHYDALALHFDAIGVACKPSQDLDQLDFLFDDLSRHMAGVDPPGMLDMPGVKPEQVGRFYEAAAAFYLRAPWRALGYEAVIRVECDRYQSGPWFAVLMGQSGLTLGLALYEDLALLRRMWSGRLTDEEGARKTVALTVTFDDDGAVTEADLEAIELYGWPIAAADAYPSLFRKERGLSMRPPLSWEIELMDACLRVLPDFVARRAPDDTTRELVPVPGAASPMELGLCWIEEAS